MLHGYITGFRIFKWVLREKETCQLFGEKIKLSPFGILLTKINKYVKMDFQVKGQKKKKYPKWVVCTLDCTLESSQFSSVQSLSRVWLFATPWIAARQASVSITNSRSSPKLMCIELVMPSSHLILCRLFSSCPQSLPASVLSNESTRCTRWPKYWSFSFSSSPSSEHPELISIRMDWLDLLAVQGTFKRGEL